MHSGTSSQAILGNMLATVISVVTFILNRFTILNLAPADIQTVVYYYKSSIKLVTVTQKSPCTSQTQWRHSQHPGSKLGDAHSH